MGPVVVRPDRPQAGCLGLEKCGAMARCQQCGRVNRDGSIFCQDCGQRLPPGPGTGPVQAIQGAPPPAQPFPHAPAPHAPAPHAPPPPAQPHAPAPPFSTSNQGSAPTMFPDQVPGGVAFPATRVRAPTPVAGVPVGLTCPACRTVNPPGMNFCKMCGAPMRSSGTPAVGVPAGSSQAFPGGLPAPSSVARAPSSAAVPGVPPLPVSTMPSPAAVSGTSMRPCSTCGQATPSAFSFCQHCGARASAVAAPAPAPVPAPAPAPMAAPAPRPPPGAHAPGNDAVAATIAVSPAPAAMPHAAPSPGSVQRPNDAYLPTLAPSGAVLAASLGTLQGAQSGGAPAPIASSSSPTPAAGIAMQPAPHAAPASGPTSIDTFRSPPPTTMPAPVGQVAGAWGRLVAVHRDGSDGQAFPLAYEHVAIGRSEGEILFPDDRYLAPRHVQLERRGVHTVLRVLDDINGAYARITSPHVLSDGEQFLIGKQVMRFETVASPERDAPPAMQHGVLLFGSPPRVTWGRLRQQLTSGQTRDVVHLSRSDITLGREEGELRFPDDEFMSRRHATLSHHSGRVHLADLGSSNGTYVRLRAERELCPGDLIRVGDQLLRYEPT